VRSSADQPNIWIFRQHGRGLVTVRPFGVAVGLYFLSSDVDAGEARRVFPPTRIVRLVVEWRRIAQSGSVDWAKLEEHLQSTYRAPGRYPVHFGGESKVLVFQPVDQSGTTRREVALGVTR